MIFVDSVKPHGEKLTLLNPVDDSVVADDVPVAGREDVDRAVALGREAFRKGPWAKFTGIQRSACLNKFADLVEKNVERLAYAESLPTGRPVAGIVHFDLAHMVQVFRYYAGWADKIAGESFGEDNGFAKLVRYKPLGVCAGIASWNATFMYVGWKVAPALAAGNSFIFKPSEKSPLGVLALAPLFAEAGFPPAVVQFIIGGRDTGSLLASHMEIAKISFTGSISAGKAVQEAATRSNLKKTTLELGGKSPALVFGDADFENAVGSVAGGFLANSGQICVAASRVLVEESIAAKFLAAAKATFDGIGAQMGSSPLELSTSHGPVVDKLQFDRIMSYIDKGKASAQLLTGGNRIGSKGCFIEPTLFVNPDPQSPIWKEEVFGPVLTVRTFKTEEEAIAMANDSIYGLAACIYTSDVSRALRVSAALESGGVAINSPYLPELNTPFGAQRTQFTAKHVTQYLGCSHLMMDPTEYFTNSAPTDPTITKTDHYIRRTHVINASVPKPGDVSIRWDLSSRLRLAAHEYNVLGAESSGYTLILTHGTSFNRFFWELVIDYMLSKPGVKTAVKRIIAIDAANHGDSALLNHEVLPSKACWPDDSRDILRTLEHFNVQQPVIGIGHSFGGGSIAALTSAFEKGFHDWDKRQLDVFLEQGVVLLDQDDASSGWTLKTPKEQESATYLAAPHPQILHLLERSKRRHHFIWGSDSTAISAENRQLVERMVHHPSTTQVIPMTHPERLSSIIAGILHQEAATGFQTEIPQRFRL
ncbi:uncharacterized protein LA080_014329 [Diaporthe eres]|nr:uncharacterized protein LA080_014329 [Diaporthe eres]